jgi:hypothetical protein
MYDAERDERGAHNSSIPVDIAPFPHPSSSSFHIPLSSQNESLKERLRGTEQWAEKEKSAKMEAQETEIQQVRKEVCVASCCCFHLGNLWIGLDHCVSLTCLTIPLLPLLLLLLVA